MAFSSIAAWLGPTSGFSQTLLLIFVMALVSHDIDVYLFGALGAP